MSRFIIFLLWLTQWMGAGAVISAAAQTPLPVTPGLPWTYLPNAEMSARDSAFIAAHLEFTNYGPDLRYFFKIHLHPEIAVVEDRQLNVELPREPDSAEIMTYSNGYVVLVSLRATETDTLFRWDIFGSQFDSAKNRLVDIGALYTPSQVYDGDSIPERLWGTIRSSPGYYALTRADHSPPRVAFFLQFVDSLYHPPLVSAAAVMPLQREVAVRPNPCISHLTIALPDEWRRRAIDVTVVDPRGQRVLQRGFPAGRTDIRLDSDAFAALPGGVYGVHLAPASGGGRREVAVTTFVKLN